MHIIIYWNWKYTLAFINFNLAFNTYTNTRTHAQALRVHCMCCGMWPIVNHVVFYVVFFSFTNARILNTFSEKKYSRTIWVIAKKKLDLFYSSCLSWFIKLWVAVQISMKYHFWYIFWMESAVTFLRCCEIGFYSEKKCVNHVRKLMNKRTCISFQTMGLVKPNKSTKTHRLFDSRILLNQPFFIGKKYKIFTSSYRSVLMLSVRYLVRAKRFERLIDCVNILTHIHVIWMCGFSFHFKILLSQQRATSKERYETRTM